MRPASAVLLLLLIRPTALVSAQAVQVDAAATTAMRYEVVSIRPVSEGTGSEYTDDGVLLQGPLKWFIANANGMRLDAVQGGPKWVGTQLYEVRAKVAPADVERYTQLDHASRLRMLAPVLATRCGVTAHIESHTRMAYELLAGSAAAHLKVATASGATSSGQPQGSIATPADGDLIARGISMERFSTVLTVIGARELGLPVVDHTSLPGAYDFELKWAPLAEPASGEAGLVAPANPAGNDSPDLVRAVRSELGLELRAARLPLPVLVIDTAHIPDAN